MYLGLVAKFIGEKSLDIGFSAHDGMSCVLKQKPVAY